MNNPFGSTFVYGYQNIAFEVAISPRLNSESVLPLVYTTLPGQK